MVADIGRSERSPFNGLQPLFELSISFGVDLEGSPRSTYNASEFLVIARCQVIQFLMHTLNIPEIESAQCVIWRRPEEAEPLTVTLIFYSISAR